MTYTYYDCTLCNRTAQGFGDDTLGDYGDTNGDVGKQWLALYTTKDKAAGAEITTDIIAQKGTNKMPADKSMSIRLFGRTDSVNLVDEEYCYNNSLNGLCIFSGTAKADEKPSEQPADTSGPDSSAAETVSETDTSSEADTSSEDAASSEDNSSEEEAKAAGSVVGTGTMIVSCVGSAALGALICFLISRKKREDNAA